MATPRERTEQQEAATLSPQAVKSAESRGRARPEDPCPIRTAFQRDRDRIIHSKAFRRLSHKTQVFIATEADHFRTRLTHTLEVAQIARTIARALHLNEDLTEAIALGHDLGHTPFGHAGESALDTAYRSFDPEEGFHHAAHSLRVVEALEKEGQGLNLTWEVRDGIVAHSKGMDDLPAAPSSRAATLEGAVVMYADRVAYINHDIDDAMRAGLLTADSLPPECLSVLGDTHAKRITAMVTDLVEHSEGRPEIAMGKETLEATNRLKDFVLARVYREETEREFARVTQVVTGLFGRYMEEPALVPDGPAAASRGRKALARAVCDYLAGMTDRFAAQQFERHFVPPGSPAP